MAALVPFRALRPIPSSAARVAAVPYDVVTAAEARALAAGEPLSFLHVSRAEIDLPSETDPHADAVYAKAVMNMAELTAAAPLVMDASPAVYLYRLRMGAHVQTGVAACFAIDEYERDLIRKHEKTRREKEDDRTRHMMALRAQTGPVFLTYRASAPIRDITERAVGEQPLFDFASADGIQHTIWRLDSANGRAMTAAFEPLPAVYIADGHHRAASAARVCRQLRETGGAGEWDTFLGAAFPHDEVQVLAYNRVVRDHGAETPGALLDAMRQRAVVRDGPPTPERRGDVAMYLGDRWHTIVLPDVAPGLPFDRTLDVSRLQESILTPLLRIGDITTDQRIDFVGGGRGTETLERLVGSGEAAVAFSLYPVSVDDVMRISDAGGIMPPKSTWFEPKLRDGLLSHVI